MSLPPEIRTDLKTTGGYVIVKCFYLSRKSPDQTQIGQKTEQDLSRIYEKMKLKSGLLLICMLKYELKEDQELAMNSSRNCAESEIKIGQVLLFESFEKVASV